MEQVDVLRRAIEVLEQLNITYMVGGSIACSVYGEPRATLDIDVVVDLRPDQIRMLCEAFPPDEWYVSEEAVREAVAARDMFNVIHGASGNKIDFIVAKKDPWGRQQMAHRRRVRILPDCEGYAAAPEDIIISKMAYYRQGGHEKHLRDITGILKTSDEPVDRAYIAQWAEQLGLTEIWQAILRRVGQTGKGLPEGAA